LLQFEREAQITSQLAHPSTIQIYDFGRTEGGVFYYAMEYIDGLTLYELVGLTGPQPAARVIAILVQICGSLAEAHAAGLVHRDIKSANIMLSERGRVADVVKLLSALVPARCHPGTPWTRLHLAARARAGRTPNDPPDVSKRDPMVAGRARATASEKGPRRRYGEAPGDHATKMLTLSIPMPFGCARFAPALMLSVTLLGACKSDDGRGGGSAARPATGGATGGTPVGGSTSTGGAGAAESGAGGAGGSAKAGCQGTDLGNRLCAAFDARQCSEPLDCLGCVEDAREQRRPYEGCAACALAFDAWYQCAVNAFEAGNVLDGVHCVDGHAEVHPGCGSSLESAIQCNVAAEKGCPTTWPQ
jgi:hypothetical protein